MLQPVDLQDLGFRDVTLIMKNQNRTCNMTWTLCLHNVSSVFLVVEPSKIIFLIYNTIPHRRTSSYSILGTIEPPNRILLM